MPTRRIALTLVALVAGCGGSTSSMRPVPVPRPPEPTVITLPAVHVTHAPWAAPPPAPMGHNRRAMTADVAQPVLVTANDPVRACYKVLLAINPQASGTVTALMQVRPEGVVSDVETTGPVEPSLSIILPCVINALRTRRFPVTRGSSLVSYPFVFSAGASPSSPVSTSSPGTLGRTRPGELPVQNPEVISVRPWAPTVRDDESPAAVQTRDLAAQVIPDVTTLVDTCYAAALVMSPDMSGAFSLRLGVEPSGAVARIDVSDQNTLASPVRDCISTLGHRLQFHPAQNGAVVTIPVTLTHDGPDAPGTITPTLPPTLAPGSRPPG